MVGEGHGASGISFVNSLWLVRGGGGGRTAHGKTNED